MMRNPSLRSVFPIVIATLAIPKVGKLKIDGGTSKFELPQLVSKIQEKPPSVDAEDGSLPC